MTDLTKEHLSALMDGELVEEKSAHFSVTQASAQIVEVAPLKCCWERYHLIGETLRHNLPTPIKHDLYQRISAAIAAEPPLPIPLPRAKKTSFFAGTGLPLGWAAAAGMTGLAILAFSIFNTQAPVAPPRVALPTPAAVKMAQVTPPPTALRAPVDNSVPSSATLQQLRGYIADHQYFARSMVNGGGTLPSARLVGFAPAQQEQP